MSRNAIAVTWLPPATGKSEMYTLSLRSIQDYAARHGIDVHVIDTVKYSAQWPKVPHLEKLQAIDLLDTYDRVLSLDLDILINPTAPSIFDVCSERSHVYGYDEGHLSWVADDIVLFEKRYGVDMQRRMLNGGVMLWPKEARVITAGFNAATFYPSFDGTAGEQSYVNAMIARYALPVCLLDRRWNWCPYADADDRRFEERFSAYFIHYASDGDWIGRPPKSKQLKMDAQALYEVAVASERNSA